MKRYIFIVLFLLSLSGCDITHTGTRPGYIYAYVYFDVPDSKVIYDSETFTIRLYRKKSLIGTYTDGQDYGFGKSPRKDRYYELCNKFGDINSDGYPCSSRDVILTPEASFEIVRHVSIVSDNDWNANLMAGTPLDEIFTIRYFSYFPYISNRYTGAPLTSFTKTLSDLKDDEMKLILCNIELNCNSMPTDSHHHTLTISFDLDTDRTVTYHIELDFSEADTL